MGWSDKLSCIIRLLSRDLTDVREEAMESVGKVEGTVRTKSCGRNGIYSVAGTLVTSPITTSVLSCSCAQSPVHVVSSLCH